MNFSIVVLFKDCFYIQNVLDNLLCQIDSGDEIIIVNDHSKDIYLRLLNKYNTDKRVSIINSDRTGCRSYNRNFGARICKNEVLLFIDGDVYLYPNTIQKCRRKFSSDSDIAFAGNIHGLEYTLEQLSVMGFDYTKNLDEVGLNLHKNDILKDYRLRIPPTSVHTDWEWLYMYTGMFFVLREKYLATGGFNEKLLSWGGEDVEFAYRLSQFGSVKYARDLNGIHLPHERNHIKNLKSNTLNLYKLLSDHNNVYFELPIKFNNPSMIKNVLEENTRMNTIWKNQPLMPTEQNSIVINYGKDIIYKTDSEQMEHLELYGISLPFKNQYFKLAVISQDLIMYGNSILAIILQEALRVSQNVIISKTPVGSHSFYSSSTDESIIRSNVMHNFSVSINSSMKIYGIHEYQDYYTIDQIKPFIEVTL